jgi:aromatic-L-amino-acid/L-tryptophan decarboxylase
MPTTTPEALLPRLAALAAQSRQLDWTGDEARERLHEAQAFAADFLDGVATDPAWLGPPDGAASPTLPSDPAPLAEALAEYRRVALSSGVHPVSGRFFGYVPGGGVATSAIGDLLAGVTNRYAGVYLASPGAAAIENLVVERLRELLGFPASAWGTLQSGGSLATLTALVAARSSRPLSRWSRGVVYATAEAHGCVAKALAVAGLAEAPRRTVAIDAGRRMDLADLERQLAVDREAGLEPWIVVASAGTINTGVVDPLAGIADLCDRQDLWLHVDGAYGGFFGLTERGAAALAGIERADSLVLDPHKGLFQRYGCGAVLVREGALLRKTMALSADYLADVATEEAPSPADYSPELTRHFRGLGLWLTLRVHGLERIRAALEEKLLLARYAWLRLQQLPQLEVGEEPELSTCVFRVRNEGDGPTRALLDALLERGRIHLSSTRLDGRLWLRLCVLCFRSHAEDIDVAIDEIDRAS